MSNIANHLKREKRDLNFQQNVELLSLIRDNVPITGYHILRDVLYIYVYL